MAEKETDERPPNIILFLADDLGWTGLRCFGSDLYETPVLDQLAKDGMKFTNAYAACTVCSPSRAAIMTGKYPARLHVTDFIAGQNRPFAKMRIPEWTKYLPLEETTVAEALHDGGYKTAQVGKWHLDRKGEKGYGPTDHGFDREVSDPPSRGHFLAKPAGGFEKGDFVTDYLASEAAKVVEEWKDDPFFLYFAFHVPHTPVEGKAELVEEFSKKIQPDARHQNPHYAAMVKSMDEAVGTVMAQLEKSGIADRTVIVFTSDNGGLTQRYGKPDGFTDNYPLRRGKGSAYEGGVRVPMIVKWPGVTPAGSETDETVIGIDYLPTFLDIAGVEMTIPDIDGIRLAPLFRDPGVTLEREDLYWHYPHYHAGGDSPYSAIRSGKWRLEQFHEDGSITLYDLENDIGESTDVTAENPEVVSGLRLKLERWREAVDAQMPVPNPDYDPSRETKTGKVKVKEE